MKKTEIKFHSDGYRPGNPAINVKVYNFPRVAQVTEYFRCCEDTAQEALNFAFESLQETFWDSVPEMVSHHLSPHATGYSEGRQGGWLVVHNLANVDCWDGLRVSRWGNLCRCVEREIASLCSWESVQGIIEANDWAPADGLLDDKPAEQAERAHWEARDTVTV